MLFHEKSEGALRLLSGLGITEPGAGRTSPESGFR